MIQSFLASVLAQDTPPARPPTGPGAGAGRMWIGLLLMIGVFYFFLFRGNRKQKKEKHDMLANLGKNQRVMTIGGVVGTVMTVRGDYVTLKVDESTNTKMIFTKKAIQQLIADEDGATDLKKK